MRDYDSTVLRAGTQLSAFSGHLVRLLERLAQRLSLEHEETSTNQNASRMVRADLLSALELQKQVVEEHFTLVRSMLRRQGRQRHLSVVQPADSLHRGRRRNQKLSDRLDESESAPAPGRSELLGHSFTERQRQLIQLVSLGYDNRQIAQSLSIAEQTVKNHLHAIFEKAGVTRRSDLAAYANPVAEVTNPKSLLEPDLQRQREAQ